MTDPQTISAAPPVAPQLPPLSVAPPAQPVPPPMAAPVVAAQPVAPVAQNVQPVPVQAVAAPVTPQSVPVQPVAIQPVPQQVVPQPAPQVPQPVMAAAPMPAAVAPQPVPVQPAPIQQVPQPGVVPQPAPPMQQPVVAAAAPAAPVPQPVVAAMAPAAVPQAVPPAPVARNPASAVVNPGSVAQPRPAANPPSQAGIAAAKPTAQSMAAAKSAGATKSRGTLVAPSYRDKLKSQTIAQWAHQRLQEAPGYALSILLHAVVLFMLSMMVLPAKDREDLFNAIMSKVEEPSEVNEKLDDTQIVPEKLEKLEASANEMQVTSEVVAEKPNPVELDVSDAAPMIDAPDVTDGAGPKMPVGDLAGRSQKARSAMLASQGGTAASELAVNSGLKWLAKMQRPDGSWSFKHGPDDPGTDDNPTGATGMALLAFLGGGHTHKSGDYQKQVTNGIAFLGKSMKVSGAGGDLRMPGDGHGMYTQGICTIALCEAYALSKDKNLRQPTQLAVDFIINAQDPVGGGWRYQPGQKGDTSVVGWQIMALKSAKIAKLQIPNKTIGKATFFLNTVQAADGSNYGYDVPAAGRTATSAVGLLCRMYLGWTPKNAGLVKGVEFLSKVGPQPNDIYFDYYATQVLHHWGGEPWTKWNNVMRDYLVQTQEKEGNAAGSWKPVAGAAIGDAQGGRHYRTCMSIMTLEVYYRHLPIYQRETIKVDF